MAAGKEKDLVVQLRALAADPENRPYIIKQGCLPGLVMFLASEDEEITQLAIEALEYMALYKAHRAAMAKEPGLATAVRKLMLAPNPRIKRTAISVYQSVQEHLPERTEGAARPNNAEAPLTDAKVVVTEARTFHFQLRDVTDEQKQRIENDLVATKGIISFLVDISVQRAVIRSTVASEQLQKLLANSGVEVVSVEEKGDPNKTYKAPSEENKENARNSSWFGSWLVPTQQDESAAWFGGNGGGSKKKKAEQAGGWGRIGKVLWG